jgi:hypothetical protein
MSNMLIEEERRDVQLLFIGGKLVIVSFKAVATRASTIAP